MNKPCQPARAIISAPAPTSAGSGCAETHALEPEPCGLTIRRRRCALQ